LSAICPPLISDEESDTRCVFWLHVAACIHSGVHYCYGTVSLHHGRHDFMLSDTSNLELVYYEAATSRSHTILICAIAEKHDTYFLGAKSYNFILSCNSI